MAPKDPSPDVDQIITNIVFGVLAFLVGLIAIWQGQRLVRARGNRRDADDTNASTNRGREIPLLSVETIAMPLTPASSGMAAEFGGRTYQPVEQDITAASARASTDEDITLEELGLILRGIL